MSSLLAASLLSLGTSTIASADTNNQSLHLKINGQEKVFAEPPMMYNDVTLVPMRAIFEELGAEVKWDDKQQKITATKGNDTIELKLNSKDAFVNYKPIKLLQEPLVSNNTTMVPLRFIGESLGANVNWDAKTKTVTIQLETEQQEQLTITNTNTTNVTNTNTNAKSSSTEPSTTKTTTNKENVDYTLQDLVNFALSTNSKVKAGNAQVDKAEELFKRAEDNVGEIPAGYGLSAEDAIIRNTFTGYHQATINYEMAQKQQEITKESITYAVKKAYNEVHRSLEQYKISKAAVDYEEQKHKIESLKGNQGMVSNFDLTQSENKLKELKKKRDVAEQSINDAYEFLNILVGFNQKNRYTLADIPPFEEFEVESADIQVARVLRDSTAVWLADQQINLANLNVDMYTFNNPAAGDTYKSRKIDVNIKEYEKQTTKQQLEETTRKLFYNIDALKSQYEILRTQLTQAEEALKLTKVKFDTGLGIAIDLQGAQLQVDQIKQQMYDIVAQLDYLKMAYEKPWVAGGM